VEGPHGEEEDEVQHVDDHTFTLSNFVALEQNTLLRFTSTSHVLTPY